MNGGVPPTAPKARTGESTPPGMTPRARSNSSSDRVIASRGFPYESQSAASAAW